MREIPSDIKDKNDFISKIKNFSVPNNSLLDLNSLYTSTPDNKDYFSEKETWSLPKKYDTY